MTGDSQPATIAERFGQLADLSGRRAQLCEWLGFGLIALLFLYQVHSYWSVIGPAVIDDAFITLRYARELAAGNGLFYNPGDAVEGYTSFLWTLLLGAVIALGLDPLPVAQLLGVGLGLVSLWATWRIAGELLAPDPRWLRLVPPLFLATNRTFCIWSIEAMETRLFGALFALAFLAWLVWGTRSVRRVPVTGLLLGLLALTRPEGYLLALGLALRAFLRARRTGELGAFARHAGLFAGLSGAHLLFRLLAYGDLLPNTFYIKVGGLDFAGGLRFFDAASSANHVAAYGLLVLFGASILPWRGQRCGDAVYLLIICALWLLYVLAIGGDYFEFRFFDVILPLWALLAAQGTAVLNQRLVAKPWARQGIAIGLALWLIGANSLSIAEPHVGNQRITSPERERRYTLTFARAGRWLARNLEPQESIAIRPAGVIAYLVHNRAVDLLGLNDYEIARDPRFFVPGRPSGHQRHVPLAYLRQRGITYLIGHPKFAREPGKEGERTSIEIGPGEYLIFRPLAPGARFEPRVYHLDEHAGSISGWRPLPPPQ